MEVNYQVTCTCELTKSILIPCLILLVLMLAARAKCLPVSNFTIWFLDESRSDSIVEVSMFIQSKNNLHDLIHAWYSSALPIDAEYSAFTLSLVLTLFLKKKDDQWIMSFSFFCQVAAVGFKPMPQERVHPPLSITSLDLTLPVLAKCPFGGFSVAC